MDIIRARRGRVALIACAAAFAATHGDANAATAPSFSCTANAVTAQVAGGSVVNPITAGGDGKACQPAIAGLPNVGEAVSLQSIITARTAYAAVDPGRRQAVRLQAVGGGRRRGPRRHTRRPAARRRRGALGHHRLLRRRQRHPQAHLRGRQHLPGGHAHRPRRRRAADHGRAHRGHRRARRGPAQRGRRPPRRRQGRPRRARHAAAREHAACRRDRRRVAPGPQRRRVRPERDGRSAAAHPAGLPAGRRLRRQPQPVHHRRARVPDPAEPRR